MEIEEEISEDTKNEEDITKKRAHEGQKTENNKKVRLFSVKEFRKQLNQANRLDALNKFLSIINESKKHDYVFEYLENGGNCLELLQTLELDSTISPVLVFQLVTEVLLRINAKYPQYENTAFESCRYMLNSYITVINKMVNLSSTTQERKVCLKLLTTMVMFSSTLAKDVLLHVNFHSTNLELLTKHTGEKDSVRDRFIHFLTAFLVDGHYPTLSVLLEKKGFITSIINGLQYDSADTACVVVTAMKNHILENPAVSKTAKMKTFNTSVVRDIVNLYNWKGPETLKATKKNKNVTVTVDELSKSKVSECVHDFLLILCTSHKFGVIFKDHLMGLGKKNQNALMYTVLESLERPWEHSYACELVTKICGACPDLAKTMWTNLKPFLEPRLTEKWLNALKFANILLAELKPACIEFVVKELGVHQLAQIIQFLVAPLPVLKTVFPGNVFENLSVKQHVLLFLLEVLKSLELYITAARSWLNVENHRKLTTYLSNYVSRNFPDAKTILLNWENENEPDENISQSQVLETVFEIFDLYKTLAPELLDSLNAVDLELKDFLVKLELSSLQTKVINTFIDFDQSKFASKTELFSFTVKLLFKIYHENQDGLTTLNKLLKNTGIFESCLYEIHIWINGVLDLKTYDENVAEHLVESIRFTKENALELLKEISKGKTEDTQENLVTVKHRDLSPMLLGFLKCLSAKEVTKGLKVYTNFVLLSLLHSQRQMNTLKDIVEEFEIIPNNFKEYLHSWYELQEICYVKKSKGRFSFFENFSLEFLSGDVESFLNNVEINLYSDLPLNLLQMAIFYFNNLVSNGTITQNVADNCEKFIKHLINRKFFNSDCLETVLGHPGLLSNVNFLTVDKGKPESFCTKFLLACIKEFLNAGYNIDKYLQVFREKLLNTVLRIAKKPQKYNKVTDFLQTLQLINLGYYENTMILTTLSNSVNNYEENIMIIFQILTYCLEQTSKLCQDDPTLKPLDKDVVNNLTNYFTNLSKKQVDVSDLSTSFLHYFEVFPHQIEYINKQFFASILTLNDYHKNNVDFAVFLLRRNIKLFQSIQENLDICSKKGVILPLLEVLVDENVDESVLKSIFEKFEPSFTKAMQKPHKAGQHFCQSYKGLLFLVEKFLDLSKYKNYFEKVQKYEVTEVFHVKLLEVICKKVLENEVVAKQVNNMIMTFVHLQMSLFKKKTGAAGDNSKINEVATIFNNILLEISLKHVDKDLKSMAQNETLNLYFKYCLKFGVSGQAILLKNLTGLIKILAFFLEEKQAALIFEMLLSHSEFLDNVLKEHNDVKLEILSLFLVVCKNWGGLMKRSHVPVLLAAYRAMVNKCDRTILALLEMYEANSVQTSFYDFKPFLWGRAAASHYSVRASIDNVLLRQPKMGDVLDILQDDIVTSTIANYPLKDQLRLSEEQLTDDDVKCYDLRFLLQLFSQLLAPEQQVQTYKFTRSGALSLTVVALSSFDKQVRQSACHVLLRFLFHMEARQSGKDNLLWVRYIRVVTRGIGELPDFKLNNFSSIYLARMALVLTQPNHVMYVPLNQHLAAKWSLDLSGVPELYTFLHSSDVNYKEQRNFILELLRDGIRTETDMIVFLRSMAFKLFSELYSSCVADVDTKLLILDVILAVCKVPLGVKMLCEKHSLLTQIYSLVNNILLARKEKQDSKLFVSKIVQILLQIVKTMDDRHANFMVYNVAINIVNNVFNLLKEDDEKVTYEILYLVFSRYPELVSVDNMRILRDKSDDKFCKYVFEYGCQYLSIGAVNDDKCYYLRLLFVNKFKT